nr:MAG TPA: hypothetical protein [Caudoviricetes sp.]
MTLSLLLLHSCALHYSSVPVISRFPYINTIMADECIFYTS